MSTRREIIVIRDYLNQFSDRWPEEYADLYNKIEDRQQFQLTILWKYLKWARPDREESQEVWELIQTLETGGTVCTNIGPARDGGRVRYKVDIEDITDGWL